LILPEGIKRPLSLFREIEIEYESTEGMQKGEKKTRIRRIRIRTSRLKERKRKKRVKTYER